jgi:hypothetical protein
LSARSVAAERRAELVCRPPAPRLVPDFELPDLLDLEPPAFVAIEFLLRVTAT